MEALWQRPWRAGQNDRRVLCTFLLRSLTFSFSCAVFAGVLIVLVTWKTKHISRPTKYMWICLQYCVICSASAVRRQPEALLWTPAQGFGVGVELLPFLNHQVLGGTGPLQGGNTVCFVRLWFCRLRGGGLLFPSVLGEAPKFLGARG